MAKASLGVIAATAVTVLTLFLLPFTPRLAVYTAEVQRGDLVRSDLLEGLVAYREQFPVLGAQAGRLSAVHVQAGQRVQAGQLLFALDTTMEEQALATLTALRYTQEQALAAYDGAVQALAGNALEWAEKESALRQSIAAKQLRAAGDGLVEAVYVSEGDYVAAGALLGMVRSEEKCVMAVCPAGRGAQPGATALITVGNDAPVPARLVSVSAPDTAEGNAQRLCFFPVGEWGEAGQRVTVELIRTVERNVPLAPLEAFDSMDRLWVVENGVAAPLSADTARRNSEYVRVPESLLGAKVVLTPEGSGLTPGRAVKEAKAR